MSPIKKNTKEVKMKWFKHSTNSLRDENIRLVMNQFGLKGYARYYMLMEIIAEKMGHQGVESVTYPIKDWCNMISIRSKPLVEYLKYLEEIGEITLYIYDEPEKLNHNSAKLRHNSAELDHNCAELRHNSAELEHNFSKLRHNFVTFITISFRKLLISKGNNPNADNADLKLFKKTFQKVSPDIYKEDIDKADIDKEKEKTHHTKKSHTQLSYPSSSSEPPQDFQFLKFLELYPKKVSDQKKQMAHHQWRLGHHVSETGRILKFLRAKNDASWLAMVESGQDQFIPDPHNFLKNKMYFADVEIPLTDSQRKDLEVKKIVDRLQKKEKGVNKND